MKNRFFLCFLVAAISSCGGEKGPDVTAIEVPLALQRFEKDFFAIDTNNIAEEFRRLEKKYPIFISDFTHNILGLPPVNDTTGEVQTAIRRFMTDYRPIKDSTDKQFGDFDKYLAEIRTGLQHMRHYFPNYPIPKKVITFVGPIDAYYEASLGGYGDVITADALAIGLQLHLGSNFSLYTSEMGQALYPAYISRKFTPENISVNSMKNVIDDLFPDNSASKSMVEQMVEKGKRLYVLEKLLPSTHDTLLIGYTDNQLQGCYKNEGLIWNSFLRNGFLYKNEPGILKNYIGDAPSTPEFGEGAPGNIGLFTGWQIVKKYMEKNEAITLETLMKSDPKQIFEESGYRPK